MGFRRWLLALLLASIAVSSTMAQDEPEDPGPLTLQAIPLSGVPVELSVGDAPLDLRRLKIKLEDGRWLRLVECATELCAETAQRGPMQARLPEDGVSGTRMAKGSDPFVEVWLADSAVRSGTGVLPGPLAGAIAARDRAGRVHRLELPLDRGVEDVEPRLADLDGDGRDEIVVSMTREGEGASLAVVTLRQDGLAILAESEPAPGGVWRDPVAIADLDGDGSWEIATVASGDDSGRLEVWRLSDRALNPILAMKGFATHLAGTRTTGMATVADMDGDSIADLILPSLDRRSIRVISLAGGQAAEPYRIDLAAEIVTRIGAYTIKGRPRPVICVGLADGTIILLR